jgi:hypothetical protein
VLLSGIQSKLTRLAKNRKLQSSVRRNHDQLKPTQKGPRLLNLAEKDVKTSLLYMYRKLGEVLNKLSRNVGDTFKRPKLNFLR